MDVEERHHQHGSVLRGELVGVLNVEHGAVEIAMGQRHLNVCQLRLEDGYASRKPTAFGRPVVPLV